MLYVLLGKNKSGVCPLAFHSRSNQIRALSSTSIVNYNFYRRCVHFGLYKKLLVVQRVIDMITFGRPRRCFLEWRAKSKISATTNSTRFHTSKNVIWTYATINFSRVLQTLIMLEFRNEKPLLCTHVMESSIISGHQRQANVGFETKLRGHKNDCNLAF